MTEKTSDVLAQIKRPEREEDATADRMILNGARIASFARAEADEVGDLYFSTDREDPEYASRARAWADALSTFISAVQGPYLLDLIQKHDPAFADELARRLWDAVEMGDVLDESLWEFYERRGIDPATVEAAIKAHRAERQAQR